MHTNSTVMASFTFCFLCVLVRFACILCVCFCVSLEHFVFVLLEFVVVCIVSQCFDAVGWAAGRASGL